MRVGVYVGTFDPVHKGHVKVCNYLIDNHYLDKIIIIPTNAYWDKQNLTSLTDRINMLKLCFNENIEIDEKLNKFPYTYQVLNELSLVYDELYLIIGADNIEKFHLWQEVDSILNHHVIVLNRNNIDIKKYTDKFMKKEKFIVINDYPYLDISSTTIRTLIKENKISELTSLIDEKVIKYIKENNLYLD